PAEFVALARSRGLNLVGLYGMSEVQAFFARQRLDAEPAVRTLGGGFPVAASAAVRARDPDSGLLLAPGETGELERRGPSLMRGRSPSWCRAPVPASTKRCSGLIAWPRWRSTRCPTASWRWASSRSP